MNSKPEQKIKYSSAGISEMATAVTEPTTLLQNLFAPDPVTRLEAQRALESFVQDRDDPIARATMLAVRVETGRQAHIVSNILSRAADARQLAGLVELTTYNQGWVSSISRRAIRFWLENASPTNASEGLCYCLVAAARLDDSRVHEFICTVTTETVVQQPHLAFRSLIPVLHGIVAQRVGSRRSVSWILGTVLPGALNPFEVTLSELKALLPEGNLPLPADTTVGTQNLPRPASETDAIVDSTRLPRPATLEEPVPTLSLWERLFGKRRS